MSLSKKLTCKGTLLQVFYLSEAPSLPMTPYTTPYTLYTCKVFCILIHTRKGGEITREIVRGASVFRSRVENTNITDCISSL